MRVSFPAHSAVLQRIPCMLQVLQLSAERRVSRRLWIGHQHGAISAYIAISQLLAMPCLLRRTPQAAVCPCRVATTQQS